MFKRDLLCTKTNGKDPKRISKIVTGYSKTFILISLQEELERKATQTMIDRIVKEILNGVRTPPRPSSPIDSYLTVCLSYNTFFIVHIIS